jgi:hypothetical protein
MPHATGGAVADLRAWTTQVSRSTKTKTAIEDKFLNRRNIGNGET